MMRLLIVILLVAHVCCAYELRAQCDAVSISFINELSETVPGHCFTDAVVEPIGTPAGGTFSGPGIIDQHIIITEAGAGVHTYIYTVDINGVECQVAAEFTVVNPPQFGAYADLTQDPVYTSCLSDPPLTLLGEAATGLFSGPGVDGAASTFDPQAAGPGTHQISYFSVQDGVVCESYAFLSVVSLGLYTNPGGVGASFSTAICSNSLPVYLVASPIGGTFYNEAGQEVEAEIDPSALGAGTHTFEYVVDGFDCTAEATLEIVAPTEPAQLGPMETVFCIHDDPVPIVSSAPNNPPVTYIVTNGSEVDSINPAALGVGTYDLIMLHFEDNSCATNDSLLIQIVEPPVLAFNAIPDSVCITSGIYEDVTGVPAGGTVVGPGVSGSSFDPSGLSVGVYDYTYYYEDSLGACEDSLQFDITVLTGELDVNFERTASACYTYSDTLHYSGEFGTPPLDFSWDAPLGLIEWDIGDTLVVRYDQPGYYDVTLTVTDALCRTGTFTNTLDKGELQVEASPDQTILFGESADIFVEAEFLLPDLTYQWEPAETLSCDQCPNPTASPNVTTAYIVSVFEPLGCTGVDTVIVNVISNQAGNLYVPNAFTPNGDGVNDDFVVSGNSIENYELLIYDRFGELVFKSVNLSDTWTGEYQGQSLDPGVFMYVVQVTYLDGEEAFSKGSITLIK